MEFLCSFLRRHFVRKPKVALQNVSCILRLTIFRWRDCTVIKLLFTGKSMPKEIKVHSPLVHRTTQRLRMDYDTMRFLTGNWRETACSYDCKRQWNLLQNCKCYIKLDSVISKKKKTRLGILQGHPTTVFGEISVRSPDFGLVNNIFADVRGQEWTRVVQWWSTRLPPMRRGSQCWRGRHKWVEFVVGPFLWLWEVFLRVLRFFPLLKNQHFQIPISPGIRKTKNDLVGMRPLNRYWLSDLIYR